MSTHAEMMAARPSPADMRAATEAGHAAYDSSLPRPPAAPYPDTLHGDYRATAWRIGWFQARQEALQARFGDPPTA